MQLDDIIDKTGQRHAIDLRIDEDGLLFVASDMSGQSAGMYHLSRGKAAYSVDPSIVQGEALFSYLEVSEGFLDRGIGSALIRRAVGTLEHIGGFTHIVIFQDRQSRDKLRPVMLKEGYQELDQGSVYGNDLFRVYPTK